MAAMTEKRAKSAVTGTPPHHSSSVGTKAIPNYLRPSTGSCHDACKHGGHHEFEEKEAAKPKPRPRKQPSAPDEQKRRLMKVRSVSRRRVGDLSRPTRDSTEAVGEIVEWKDIVAYDAVPVPADGKKKRDMMKGKNPCAKTTEPEVGVKKQTESLNKRLAKTVRSTLTGKTSTNPQAANEARASKASPSDKSMAGKSRKAPKANNTSTTLPVEKKVVLLQETAKGDATASVKPGKTLNPPDLQEHAAAIAESSRPIPAHRRAKSMSISSRSVRFPFMRQPSKKNSDTFKLRSKSTKAPILPSEEEKPPTRLRFRKGRAAGEESSGGIQLRLRSLRRRGSGVSGGVAGAGFVVPEVTLRHQKTLEKKKSRRLYNNLIEETATKLAKNKKSRVKSLVGAFETLISKIGK
ncbi:uncharacterized protein [Lolium perenne]|uniref:uncharacterized protein n=1 Tax=Lolium perenne TaxID=4522 RepID=UPI0021EB4FAF|nr:uncharacterized protein LOC127299476 [Lolium perenne]XP_051185405.1 uncharacterized protein LOC127299476 [Lolium perenne]